MKLRSERVENGDLSGRKGEFKNRFSGQTCIEIRSGLTRNFLKGGF
jgi:hypothetical protein